MVGPVERRSEGTQQSAKQQNVGKGGSFEAKDQTGSVTNRSNQIPEQKLYESGSTHPVNAKPVSSSGGLWGIIQKIIRFVSGLFSKSVQAPPPKRKLPDFTQIKSATLPDFYKNWKAEILEDPQNARLFIKAAYENSELVKTVKADFKNNASKMLQNLKKEIAEVSKEVNKLVSPTEQPDFLKKKMSTLRLQGKLSSALQNKEKELTVKSTAFFEIYTNDAPQNFYLKNDLDPEIAAFIDTDKFTGLI